MRKSVFVSLIVAALAGCSDDETGSAPAGSGGQAGQNPSSGGSSSASGGTNAAGTAGTTLPDTPERFLPAIVSGSRLKARVLGTPGAEPIFVEWFDSELSVACEFAYAADGQYRCLPKLPGNSPIGHISAMCDDDPIVVNFRPECAEATHLQLSVAIEPTCEHSGSASEVWGLEPISTPEAYYDGTPDFCDGPRMPPESGTFARVTSVIPPATFVAGSVGPVADGDQLGVWLLQAEDGAALVLDPHDPRYGRCGQGALYDETTCAPSDVVYAQTDLYVDAACSEPVVGLGAEGDCEGPSVVTIPRFLEDGGLGISSFGLVGEELDGSVYRQSGDTCTALPVADAISGRIESLHRVDPIELLPLDSATRGSGPLRTVYVTRDDGVFLRPGAFSRGGGSAGTAYFEDESKARCTPIVTPAGDYKCMPVGGVAIATVQQFADSDCTERVTLLFPGSEAPTATPTVLFERDDQACAIGGPIAAISNVYEVGAPFQGPTYLNDTGECYQLGETDGYYVGRSILESLPDLEYSTL